MKNITFELNTSIKYAKDGEDIDGSFVELREPTGKVSHLCCEIESLIQSGILKMSGILDEETIREAKEMAKSADKDEKMDRDSILSMMSGGGVDMKKVVVNFRELFREMAFIAGEKPLTVPMMDKMTHGDFRNMMGEYAANFIMS